MSVWSARMVLIHHRTLYAAVACIMALSVLSGASLSALSAGDGQLTYGLGTTQTPAVRGLSESGWGGQTSLSTANGTVQHIITRSAPNRVELLTGIQTSNGTLVIYRYDGTSWTEQWRVTGGTPIMVPRFDIAYEQLSGRAMVLYSTNSSPSLAYRVWNGTSWTAATNYSSSNANDIALRVGLVARSGTNEIAAAWVDNGPFLSANYWDGATSTWRGEPSGPLDTKVAYTGTTKAGSRMFDMAFENVSGRLMIMWGNDNVTYPYYVLRSAGPSGTWGSKVAGVSGTTATNGFNGQGMDMQLSAEPGTNYIAYVNTADYVTSGCSANQCGSAAVWNGTSWGYFNTFDSSMSQLQPSLVRVSVKWVQSGGQSRAVVVYDDDNAAGIDWLFFNKNTLSWSAVQPDFTGAPASPAGDVTKAATPAMWLYNNPFNPAELLYVTVAWNTDTSVSGIYTKKLTFNGTTLAWSNVESALLQSGLSFRGGWSVGFAYYHYVPPAGSLSVDIVNAGGVTVVNPVVAFPGVVSGTQCRTVTAMLGGATQKIKVSNTTSTAPWTVSLAPSAGSGATWSSGGRQYDTNDPAAGGCSDGADSDTVGGQLTVKPMASTITPQSGCVTTGITKGSDLAYAQGGVSTITLLSASSSAATNCSWDVTGVGLEQKIPAFQPAGEYSLPMTVTVTAL